MAPTPAFAHGTSAPIATNFDWTATPHSSIWKSRATIENVIHFPLLLARKVDNFYNLKDHLEDELFPLSLHPPMLKRKIIVP
jgi:hypothetical protein